MKRSIVWFKADLRLHDNETLVQAIAQSDEIIPVYCFEDIHYKTNQFGFTNTGNFRAQFLLESLQDLDTQLRELGSGLLIMRGNAADEISKAAAYYGAQKVFAKKEVSHDEKETEAQLEKKLWAINCTLETYSTSTLYHAVDLPFSIKDIPDVFTSFRKRVEKESNIRPIFDSPKKITSPKIKPLELPRIQQLGLTEVIVDTRRALAFKGGETSGYKRLHYYFTETNAILTYKETRNGLIGSDYSTKFSAWLTHGCLSPREIYYELKKYESVHGENESTYWLIFELLWRDYFRFMMKKHRNNFFLQAGIKTGEPNLNTHSPASFQKWMNGQTAVDFIDANMLELKHTGFMSNRGRQNVASFLVNDLKLDWRYGAAYFEHQLIDYDVCSNWGNWAYLAGVGNDPRGNRYFNTEKQVHDYDALGNYRKLWIR